MRIFRLKTSGKPYSTTHTHTHTHLKPADKKFFHKSQQLGRSMIEMLGVLAIVGVLSIGGIAGFSEAMFRDKLNKQAEQFSSILSGIFTHGDILKAQGTGGNITSAMYYLGIIPPEMKKGNQYYDVFGNQTLNIGVMTDNQGYYTICVRMKDNGFKQCKNLFEVAKAYKEMPAMYAVFMQKQIQGESSFSQSSWVMGDDACKTNICLKNITISQIEQRCRYCDKLGDTASYCIFCFYILKSKL